MTEPRLMASPTPRFSASEHTPKRNRRWNLSMTPCHPLAKEDNLRCMYRQVRHAPPIINFSNAAFRVRIICHASYCLGDVSYLHRSQSTWNCSRLSSTFSSFGYQALWWSTSPMLETQGVAFGLQGFVVVFSFLRWWRLCFRVGELLLDRIFCLVWYLPLIFHCTHFTISV